VGCDAPVDELVCAADEILATVGDLRLDEPLQQCVPEACGASPWPSSDAEHVVYVARWGGGGGPGTKESPFGLIAAAIEAASPDGTVLVADGDYLEDVIVGPGAEGVTLQGRCTDLVGIGPRTAEEPALWIRGGDVELRDLRVVGGRGVRIQRSDDGARNATVNIRDTIVEDTFVNGIEANSGTTLELHDVLVRGNRTIEGGTTAAAIRLGTGSSATLLRVRIEDNQGSGVEAVGIGTLLDLEDVEVRRTLPIPPPPPSEERFHPWYYSGFGVLADSGAVLTARGVILEDNTGLGIYVTGPVAGVVLEDIVIRGQRIAAGPESGWTFTGGHGLAFTTGGPSELEATVRNLLIENGQTVGVGASGAGVQVDLEGVVIRDIIPDPGNGWNGIGLIATLGASVTVRDLLIEDTHYVGLAAANNSFVHVEDAEILRTHPDRDSGSGIGIAAAHGARIVASNIRVDESFGGGIVAFRESNIEASDFEVTNSGMADVVVIGSDVTLTAGVLSGAHPSASFGGGVGLFAHDFGRPPRLVVDDVAFSDYPGPGIYLRGPGSFEIRNSTFEDAGDVRGVPGGVFAAGGVTAWTPGEGDEPGSGLLLEDNHFDALGLDAVLLDSAGATMSGNTFGTLAGEPLWVQGCIGEHFAVDVDDQAGVDAACRPESRPIESLLLYSAYIGDALLE